MLFQVEELTVAISLSDELAASFLDKNLRELEKQYTQGFIARGLILMQMEERKLWGLLTDSTTGEKYSSLEKWIVSAATHSRSDCFAALKAVKELRDVPTDKLLDMPRVNVMVLQALSSYVRKQPSVIKSAQEKTNKQFLQEIQQDFPDEHIEERKTIHLSPVKSAKTVIDRAIEMAMVLEDVTTREAVIEGWAIEYIEENKEQYARVMKERA